MTFTNPIIPDFHPDPSICRVGQDYFLVTSSFEYFPGVPLFHSRGLVHWRQIGHVLTRPSQLSFAHWRPSGGIFAPTIRYHDGTFYMITTNMSGGGNFYVHTRDPFGEWSDPVWVEQGGIDPSLCFDDDGRVYLTSTETLHFPLPDEIDPAAPFLGIQQSEIDITTGKLLTTPRRIWAGTGGKSPEGPRLYRINGRYYLLIAEGGTEHGHMVTIARSDTPWGTWESCPHNPILTHRSFHSPFQALGHADLIEAHDGSWWLVCLGMRPQGIPPTAHLGRETFLAPVQWDDAGWPRVGQQGRLRVVMESPVFGPVSWEPQPERDNFDGPQLGVAWNFLGTPGANVWSLTDRPGTLRLLGNEARLDDGPPVAFVGHRQEHFACEVATRLDFEPTTDGEEAGLTVWMNPAHHYDLFVTRQDGQRRAIVRRRIGSLVADVARVYIQPGPIMLMIQAEPDRYTFGVLGKSGEQQILATGETRYLAPEVAGLFKGYFSRSTLAAAAQRPPRPRSSSGSTTALLRQIAGDGIEPEQMNLTLFDGVSKVDPLGNHSCHVIDIFIGPALERSPPYMRGRVPAIEIGDCDQRRQEVVVCVSMPVLSDPQSYYPFSQRYDLESAIAFRYVVYL